MKFYSRAKLDAMEGSSHLLHKNLFSTFQNVAVRKLSVKHTGDFM